MSAFAPHIARSDWDVRECRVERNVERILALLADANAKATFFTLGWIAERYPQIVRAHRGRGPRAREPRLRAPARERAERRRSSCADIRLAKAILEDIGGATVARLPRAELFDRHGEPVGVRRASPRPAIATARASTRSGTITTACPTRRASRTKSRPDCSRSRSRRVRVLSRNLPAGGGGYFRLLPYALSRWIDPRGSTRSTGSRRSSTSIPWELDPGQPRVAGIGAKTRFRHYVNLRRMAARLTRLLRDFRWDRVDRVFLDGGADGREQRHPAATAADAHRPHGSRAAVRAGDAARWDDSSCAARDATFFHRAGWQRHARRRVSPPMPLPATPSATGAYQRRAAARAKCGAACSAMRWCRCRSASTAAPSPPTMPPRTR